MTFLWLLLSLLPLAAALVHPCHTLVGPQRLLATSSVSSSSSTLLAAPSQPPWALRLTSPTPWPALRTPPTPAEAGDIRAPPPPHPPPGLWFCLPRVTPSIPPAHPPPLTPSASPTGLATVGLVSSQVPQSTQAMAMVTVSSGQAGAAGVWPPRPCPTCPVAASGHQRPVFTGSPGSSPSPPGVPRPASGVSAPHSPRATRASRASCHPGHLPWLSPRPSEALLAVASITMMNMTSPSLVGTGPAQREWAVGGLSLSAALHTAQEMAKDIELSLH
ncbi:uncharacterized protein LOC134387712 [Cynocephalus volans]|uniref:uncharacterized protein LOC134387712 n=1 Tax=Cynocephalus volans TaxID=110931 RepID=UPI002FC8CE0F